VALVVVIVIVVVVYNLQKICSDTPRAYESCPTSTYVPPNLYSSDFSVSILTSYHLAFTFFLTTWESEPRDNSRFVHVDYDWSPVNVAATLDTFCEIC
jgi:hypothetical protein